METALDLGNRLREFSGLDIASLARIFKVSRATYHRCLRGLPVSKRHSDYILEILLLLEETAQRLGSPEAVSTWLLTPISSGGKKPIEYLAEKQYDLFRGFLLRQRTGEEQFRPLKASRRVFKPRNHEEVEGIREQIRPHTWYDEEIDPNNSNGRFGICIACRKSVSTIMRMPMSWPSMSSLCLEKAYLASEHLQHSIYSTG